AVGSQVRWIHFFSQDSRFLSVNYWNGTNYLWDITRQKIVLTAPEHDWWALSPDSRLLAASHPDGFWSLYSTDSSEEVRRVSLQAYLQHLLFHPDGTKIAGVPPTEDRIEIVDVDKGETFASLWAPSNPACLAFSGDGRWLAAGTDDGRLYVWNITTREVRLDIDAHQSHVTSLEFNHAGTLLASVS